MVSLHNCKESGPIFVKMHFLLNLQPLLVCAVLLSIMKHDKMKAFEIISECLTPNLEVCLVDTSLRALQFRSCVDGIETFVANANGSGCFHSDTLPSDHVVRPFHHVAVLPFACTPQDFCLVDITSRA